MSKLHVNISEIRNVSTSLRMMNNQVIYAKEEIDRVRRNTDPKIKARNNIGAGLDGLHESLEYIQRNVLNLVNFIDEAMDRYERCEGNIEKEGQAIINSYQGLMVTLGQLSSVIPMTAGMSKNEEMFYNIGDSEVNSEEIEIEDVDDDESEKTKEKELEKIQKETEKESHESLFSEVIAYMKYGKKGQEILDKEAENEVIEDDKITEQISKFDIKGLRGDLDEASESITGMDFDNTLNAVTMGGEGAAVSDVKSVSKDIEIGSKEGEKLLNNFIDKIVDDSDSIKGESKAVSYDRPSNFRKGVRDEVWENTKNTNGDVIDPVTGKVMDKSEPWDMGHKPGFEFRKHQQSAIKRDISRKQFLNEYNKPEHYRPELPSSNRSHKGEDVTDNYFGD